MIQESIKKIISVSFGVLFSFIGFANAYWGNDPYFGLAIICISFFITYHLLIIQGELSPQGIYLFLKLSLGF